MLDLHDSLGVEETWSHDDNIKTYSLSTWV